MNQDTDDGDQLVPDQEVQLTAQLPGTGNLAKLQAAFEKAVADQMAELPKQEMEFRIAEAARRQTAALKQPAGGEEPVNLS